MPGSEYVQSVQRGIAILREVAAQPGRLGPGELATRLELKGSTVHNLARTLVAETFLTRGPDGCYDLGAGLLALVGRGAGSDYLQRVEQALRRLGGAFPRSVVTYVEIEHAQLSVRMRLDSAAPEAIQRPGVTAYPLYAKATGLAALACADAETVQDLRHRHPFYEQGAHLWGSLERLEAFLAEVRATGLAVCPFEEPGFFRAAAPVRSACGALLGLLGLSLILPPQTATRDTPATRDTTPDTPDTPDTRISAAETVVAARRALLEQAAALSAPAGGPTRKDQRP